MLAELIMLTPGRQEEFIDCQKANLEIVVLPFMDVKTQRNLTLELLKLPYWLQEFTLQWLNYAAYSNYQPLFTTQDEWTIVKYVMEGLRPFRYWTLWMSQRNTVTLHHIIPFCNDMMNRMDAVMRA